MMQTLLVHKYSCSVHICIGIRLISDQGTTDMQEASALNYHFHDIDIYSNSYGPVSNYFFI